MAMVPNPDVTLLPASIACSLVDSDSSDWGTRLDLIRSLLGSPNNPRLFPPHFMKATFPKLGGLVMELSNDGVPFGYALMFPRKVDASGRVWTARLHLGDPDAHVPAGLGAILSAALHDEHVVLHDPREHHRYVRQTLQDATQGLEITTADSHDAVAIRAMQQRIWGSQDDFLYPSDLHSDDFRAGVSLAAHMDGDLVGFLFGFSKFGGNPLPSDWAMLHRGEFRLESQLLGVAPDARQGGIGAALKRWQALAASREGIGIVNWTVDPLQFGNAVLNFGRLRAVCFDFFPNFYEFRNKLNQVPAARLGITWLTTTSRVEPVLRGESFDAMQHLDQLDDLTIVNDGPSDPHFEAESHRIAMEIPADWTGLQRDDLRAAFAWRATTDLLLDRYLGSSHGQYMITGVARSHERCYLVAERLTAETIATYGH